MAYSSENIKVSVLLPTRKRPNLLLKNLQIMMDLAKDPKAIEVLIRVDDDDIDTIEICNNSLFFKKYNVKMFIGPRLGYKYIWFYLMYLTLESKGDILTFSCDDFVFEEKEWDSMLLKYKDEEKVIGSKFAFAITRKIMEKEPYLQKWSAITTLDVAIEEWAEKNNKLLRIDPWVKHVLKADMVYKEGYKKGWNLKNVDHIAFDYLVKKYNIKNMIDIGCGLGGMELHAKSKNIEAIGIDKNPYMHTFSDPIFKESPPIFKEHDYTKLPYSLSNIYDLCWIVGFLNKSIEKQHLANIFATINSCKIVCCTYTISEQKDYNHTDYQFSKYWLDIFKKNDFKLSLVNTCAVRNFSKIESMKQTGLVFLNQNYPIS